MGVVVSGVLVWCVGRWWVVPVGGVLGAYVFPVCWCFL